MELSRREREKEGELESVCVGGVVSGNRGCDDEGVTEALGHQHLRERKLRN